jgi:type IV secretory pathway VirD2 relaxase
MKQYKSESTTVPVEWDLESSKTTKYHNTNVVEIPAKEEKAKMYKYDVKEYTNSEYESFVLSQTRADTDYIAIMTGVDL